ncbi:MAG: amino acid adenylation domain-containing protein, partial [Algicola sp.]|nr:amino acid adenylation domain-containing protein [Algicola sp.]
MSKGEIEHLLYGLNDTHVDYPEDKCIHELFEQRAADNPDNIAVWFEDQQLDYQQLNDKANQLAHYLKERLGVKPDTLVGLCTERSFEMVIGILAILKAGGAYVPLDPSYPQDRLNYMCEDAALDVVLTQSQLYPVLSGFNGTILTLDGLAGTDNAQTAEHFCKAYSTGNLTTAQTGLVASNLAYVIYTSGSTGKPKGVMVEHQALFNRIHWMHNKYGMNAHDKVLQKTPYSFDVSVWEFAWTLAYGAQLVVARPEGHKDPDYLCALIERQGITKLHFVPSMLGVILQSDGFKNCRNIEQVFCSGEALQQGHVQGFRTALPGAQLHNLYGPTEAAIDVSYWDCSGDITLGVPIGKPIDNIQLVILDSNLNVVPQGSVGELHIGGDGLARGYLNLAQLTAQTFIENPYYDAARPNSSARLYKTGDLASLRHDGEIEYQGRTDHQVKIRGLLIELGEVEHQLGGLATVDSALVMATQLNAAMQLVGYVKPVDDIDQENISQYIATVKSELGQIVPAHMVPSILMVIEQWPLTANGKVDRKALPAPDGSALQDEYVTPETETEQA